MAKGILAILGSPKGEGESGSGGETEPEASIEENAMTDFLAASKSGDTAGMAAAFKRAYSACAASKSEGMDEEY